LFCAAVVYGISAREQDLHSLMPAGRQQQLQPVTPYLTFRSRTSLRKDIYRFLQLNRDQLSEVHAELDRLEEQRSVFLERMEEMGRTFSSQQSLLGVGEDRKDLSSIAGMISADAEFHGEMYRRKQEYEKLYQVRRAELEQLAEEYHEEIARLIQLDEDLQKPAHSFPDNHPAPHLDQENRKLFDGYVRALQNKDAEGALSTAETLADLPLSGDGQELAQLLADYAAVAGQYEARLRKLRTESPLRVIAMSYLGEEYEKADRVRARWEEDELIGPLLSGLDRGLGRAIDTSESIDERVRANRQIRRLVERAEKLEQSGNFESSISLYEQILLQPLQAHDREYLTRKLISLWVPAELKKVKREQNTRAVKYLESARTLESEGKDRQALEFYRMLVEECPFSDYVDTAVERIVRIAAFKG
jgi:hypothetical protein